MFPSNPSLVAIIFIIQTDSGPRHVFHYPPRPGKDKPQIRLDYDSSSDEEFSSSSDLGYGSPEDEKSSDDETAKYQNEGSRLELDIDESGSVSPEKSDGTAWNRSRSGQTDFLGLPLGLKHLLCPPRTAHKNKFEISIDGLTFLGWPVFSRKNGKWQRKKKRKKKKKRANVDISTQSNPQGNSNAYEPGRLSMQNEDGEDGEPNQTSGDDSPIEDIGTIAWDHTTVIPDAIFPRAEEYNRNRDTVSDQGKEKLNMFHIVFILDPPPLEHQVRVSDMYNHVVKKFCRALRFEQAQSDYVLREAGKIRELEAKGGMSNLKKRPHHLPDTIQNLLPIRLSNPLASPERLQPSIAVSPHPVSPTSPSHLPSLFLSKFPFPPPSPASLVPPPLNSPVFG